MSIAAKVPTTTLENISPTVARIMLERGATNRPISPATVAAYAQMMKKGQWRVTNQGLGFDKDGRLIDGQHRVSAVIMSGVTVQMMVTRDLDTDDRDVIDAGRQQKVSDRLTAIGYKNATHKAALVRQATYGMSVRRARLDALEMRAFLGVFDEELERFALSRFRAPLSGALWVTSTFDGADMKPFVSGVLDGQNLASGMPAYALREIVLAQPSMGAAEMFGRALVCAQAFAEGRQLRVVKLVSDAGRRFFRPAFVKHLERGGFACDEASRSYAMPPEVSAVIAGRRKAIAGSEGQP